MRYYSYLLIFSLIGLLHPPGNLRAEYQGPSSVHLIWDPPFTLDITSVELDISNYTVQITNVDTGEVWEKNGITQTNYVFTGDPCHEYTYKFRVFAWNVVGRGEAGSIPGSYTLEGYHAPHHVACDAFL